MKIITRTKLTLPRWVVSRLPLGEEDQKMSSIVVPMILFPLMAIGILWYELYSPSWIILGIILTVFLLLLLLAIVWWLLVQVNVLVVLRKRYVSCYKIIQDQEEKLEIKRKLEDLCVNVESLMKT